MKIYPSKHNIKVITDKHIDTKTNIPLSYIDMDYTKYNISKAISENFTIESKSIILPGDSIEDLSTKIFDENGEKADNDYILKSNKDSYVYYPKDLMEFVPKLFKWDALIKRNEAYSISKNYNLSIGCSDDMLALRSESIFVNPADRGIVTTNISVNNNAANVGILTNNSIEELDFAIIETPDCIKYSSSEEIIDIHEYLDKNTNIWLSCDKATDFNSDLAMFETLETTAYYFKRPLLKSRAGIGFKKYFNTSLIKETASIKIHNIFDTTAVPILILEYENAGFVIISHSEIFTNPRKYSDAIYEVLMYVHLQSYKRSTKFDEWITYARPNYEVVGRSLKPKNDFVSNIDLSSYFNLDSNNYSLVKINIYNDSTSSTSSSSEEDYSTNGILCIGISENKPIFYLSPDVKIDNYTELPQEAGYYSVYYNNKIYFLSSLHFLIENDLNSKVHILENKDKVSVKISSFISSSHKIHIEKSVTIDIPLIISENDNVITKVKDAKYVFYLDHNGSINYCNIDNFDKKNIKLFEVIVKQNDEAINQYDLRQLGGGLPDNQEDNFNLFDIGHIHGRPYRRGGTLIVTLPKKYEKHKELITATLDKYKVSEDFIALYFEDN